MSPVIKTVLTEVFAQHINLKYPIVSAPMAYAAGGKLAAAVSNGGGFGFIGTGCHLTGDWALSEISTAQAHLAATTQRSSSVPIGIGFLNWWLDKNPTLLSDVLTKSLSPLAAVWFSFGAYHPHAKLVKLHWPDAKIFVQVSHVQEAIEAATSNLVDVVVLQGSDSGGHGSTTTIPTLPLLASTYPRIPHGFPLLAAGGQTVGRHIAACLALGASGVVMGTRFVCSDEALSPKESKDAILRANDGWVQTVRTSVFDQLGGFDWPKIWDGRAMRNEVTRIVLDEGGSIESVKEEYKKAMKEKDTKFMVMYMGTGIGEIKSVDPAEKIVNEVGEEAAEIIAKLGSSLCEA